MVAREQVRIDGAGKYDTDDYGEFEFDLAVLSRLIRSANAGRRHLF